MARRYLERGTRERPYDGKLWIHAGQFIAFIGPLFIKEEQESERWRVDGAKMIAHGVELGGDTYRSLAATTILGTPESGRRRSTISSAHTRWPTTPTIVRSSSRKLQALQVDTDAEQAITAVDRELSSYRFLKRSTGLLIGPRRSPAPCAGPGSYERHGCAPDWQKLVNGEK